MKLFLLDHKVALAICGVIVAGVFAGCCKSKPVYTSQRVNAGDCFRGIPHQVFETHRAVVSWSKPDTNEVATTNHICRIPVTYATDVDKAVLGTTHAIFEFNPDGSLKKTDAGVDQQVDEFIKAIGDVVEDVSKLPGTQRSGDGVDPYGFVPPLDDSSAGPMTEGYFITDIQIIPLG